MGIDSLSDIFKYVKMNVGIGITTTPSRSHMLQECLENIEKRTKVSNLYVFNDIDYRGVAYAKNMCLKNLKHNSYIFLFDDDCFPIDSNWMDYLIDCFDYTGEHHFLFLNDKLHHPMKESNHVGITKYKECGGVFMALTSRALNTVGYMDSEYKGWGFEHAGWSNRVYKHGLNSAPYLMPNKLPVMLYAYDYNKKIESSISNEEKQKNYQHNMKVFQRELVEHNTYKPFKK